jgi:hypothetical protein
MRAGIHLAKATCIHRTLIERTSHGILLVLLAIACWAGAAVAAEEAPLHETIHIQKTIAVDPGKTWSAIRGIGGLDRWFPVIATCRVEGSGVGATRILTLKPNGAEMRDEVLEISDDARRFRYQRVKSPFPISKYIGTVEVQADGAARSILTWSVDMDVVPAHRDEMVALLTKAISDGIDGLEQDLR